MTKSELLDGIRAGREQLESLWAGLDDAQMTRRPGPQADWSVKDLIAHLTYWEQLPIRAIETTPNGGEPVPDPGTDVVNAQVLAENYDRPLADVRADFERSRREFEALVAKLSDEELNAMPRFQWEYKVTLGAVFSFVSAAGYAGVLICGRFLASSYHPLQITAVNFGAGTLVLVLINMVSGIVMLRTAQGWLLVVYLSLVPTALAYWLFQKGLRSSLRRRPASSA